MDHPEDLQVLYADTALLVINKPAGLSTLPDGYDPALPHVKSLLEPQMGRLWTVHRLDKGTSGVLLFARSVEAHRALNTQFERHQVSKVYHAIVAGIPEWQEKTVTVALRPNGDRHHRTVVDLQGGKPAVTHLKVLERFDGYCLLEASPETGRTHQIRAHLSSLGLNILGDKLYRPKTPPNQDAAGWSPRLLNGMALHARSLQVSHPDSGEELIFVAPYSLEWDQVLRQLRSLTFTRSNV